MNGVSEISPALQPRKAPLDGGRPSPMSKAAFTPFFIAASIVGLSFAKPIFDLVKYSASESFYSHILLIPLICGYLIWSDRAVLPLPARGPLVLSAGLAGIAFLILVGYFLNRAQLSRNDALTWTILPLCLLVLAAALAFLGPRFVKSVSFPLGFLFFIVPFPEAMTNAMEIGSQIASAHVYSWMLTLTGTPFFRDGQEFRLPGLSLIVAQECSGIRSSFVLFLTSLLAGHMFLKSRWKRAFLAFVVIPLGLVRNGFRVLTLSLLTIYVDPRVIESPLHHRGGPIFFALSLLPFFLLLWWLRKSERKRQSVGAPAN